MPLLCSGSFYFKHERESKAHLRLRHTKTAMTTNFKITIEYDGTPFSGWQIQNDKITVQGEIEKSFSCILNQKIKINGAGRTDAGVHAMGQVANFHAVTSISCNDIRKGVNSIIHGPVVIRKCEIVNSDFHARYNALSKEYHYHILNRSDPCAIGKNYIWHIKQALDLEKMNQCCSVITGSHDFKSFEGAGSPRAHTIRKIFSARMEKQENNIIIFKIKANGFLRFMVRNIVGTLVQAGLSKLSVNDFKSVLKAKNRNMAGPTAPPHGLFMIRVNYISSL